MAGFKQTLANLDPVLFLTFDGDQFDRDTRELISATGSLMDESRYANNAILQSYAPVGFRTNYRMGMPSQVDLEQTDQYAISFGFYGYQTGSPDPYNKAYMEVIHQNQYAFPNFNGSFTINFMLKRDTDEQPWRQVTGRNVNLNRPVARKAGVMNIYFQDVYLGTNRYIIEGPEGKTFEFLLPTDSRLLNLFYAKPHMFTLVYDVVRTPQNNFECNLILYVDGREVGRQTWTKFDTPPVVDVTSSWELMGTINPATNNNDMNTTPNMIDQFAVFNKAFTPDQVATLWRKTRTYGDIIISAGAVNYWAMGEAQSLTSSTMSDSAWSGGSSTRRNGRYVGVETSQVVRQKPGPVTTLGSIAAAFEHGGQALIPTTSFGEIVYQPGNNFTVEMWVNWRNNERSVLFQTTADEQPFSGMTLQANRARGIDVPGTLELSFSDNEDDRLRSRVGFPPLNDGQWHHITIVRRNTSTTELWIDGIMHDTKGIPPRAVGFPGRIYFMSSLPGQLSTTGLMCDVAIYAKALQPQEIRARVAYSLIYRIQGTVTMLGNPYQANVRVYDHLTGNLVQQVLSDGGTGHYTINLATNEAVDVTVLNMQDPNVRYRVYGPITPAQQLDSPTS